MNDDLLRFIPLAALFISILALCVSSANVGWSVYKEISLRGRIKVSFGARDIFHPTFEKPLTRVMVNITNCGPGAVHLKMVIWKKSSLFRRIFRRVERGVIIHDYEDKLSGRLPAKLEVGEGIDILLGTPEVFDVTPGITHFGINDTFGRSHWAPRRDVREFIEYKKKLQNAA